MSDQTPVYACKRVPDNSITVDGELDDPGWTNIEPVGDFILSDGSRPAARQTVARACWDSVYLYISFESDDPDIWGTFFRRDQEIFEEEVVEAFLDPDSDLVEYYEFQTSPRGTLFDAVISNPTGSRDDLVADRTWDCDGWLSAVHVDGTLDNREDTDKSWTVEWAIPFASIPGGPNNPPKPGDTWRVNLYRIDRTPTPEFSCWSPTLATPPNFHIPTRFGTLLFVE